MNTSTFSLRALALAGAAFAAGCASTPQAPDVPAALRVPAGQELFLEVLASGVQIYECSPKAGSADHEWAFRAPEATLADRSGRSLGKHYAGPSWEGLDGSIAVGEVKGRDAGPDKSAIPWLLLNAKSTSGNGLYSKTRSVQRLATTGGLAPATACNAGNAKQVARVPYTAIYYFYH